MAYKIPKINLTTSTYHQHLQQKECYASVLLMDKVEILPTFPPTVQTRNYVKLYIFIIF